MDPQVVAYAAIADIEFGGGVPQLGPPPEVNPWDMVVVGYPLWLWTDGPTSLSDSAQVSDLAVELDATATRVEFDMGDEGTVICDPSSARAWSRAVETFQESPTCGYTYQQRSMTPEDPEATYTVSATTIWEIAWTVGGDSGLAVIDRTESVEVPVGELQALVTG